MPQSDTECNNVVALIPSSIESSVSAKEVMTLKIEDVTSRCTNSFPRCFFFCFPSECFAGIIRHVNAHHITNTNAVSGAIASGWPYRWIIAHFWNWIASKPLLRAPRYIVVFGFLWIITFKINTKTKKNTDKHLRRQNCRCNFQKLWCVK